MVAGIEFGKDYAQICVKTDSMKESESFGCPAGEELEAVFGKLLKMIKPYGNPEKLKYLVFVLEENTEKQRAFLRKLAQGHHISPECIRFLDRKESFCTYVFHQQGELLVHHALLIESRGEEQRMFLLHKKIGTMPAVAEVREISGEKPENILSVYSISSVFLLGDFAQEWQERYLKLLKKGRRVFAGKNLYVKGACFRAAELAEGKKKSYLYVGEETLRCDIALKGEKEEMISVAEAGKNWYESNNKLDVLLLDGEELEFILLPLDGKGKTVVPVHLKEIPKRPKKATRLRVSITFSDIRHAHYQVCDLGFGELFPPSDVVYEGELQWEQ